MNLVNNIFYQRYKNNKYVSNTIWLLIENMTRLIAGLAIGIYVARFLGPANFGIYSYVIAFVALFSAIAKLGLDTIIIRDLVQNENATHEVLSTSYILKVAGAALTLIIVLILISLININLDTKYFIIIVSLGTFFQASEVIDFYYQSKVMSRYVSICKLCQLFLSSIMKVFFIVINADLKWFIMLLLFDQLTLCSALFLSFFYRERDKEKIFFFDIKFNKVLAKKMIVESWPLIIAGIGVMLYMRLDQIMIEHYLDSKNVGLFSAAVKISEIVYFLPTIICSSYFPALVQAKTRSHKLFMIRSAVLFDTMSILGYFFAIFIFFLSPQIIHIAFGAQYAEAANVLSIHIWSFVFVASGIVGGKWLITQNLALQSMYRTVAGAIINIVLNFYMIPRYGIIGSALATVISQFVASIAFNAISSKTRGCFYLQMRSLILPGTGIIQYLKGK